MNTKQFMTAVGRKKMADALKVARSAVSNAAKRDAFPPAWLKTCERLAAEHGIECPPELFAQRPFYIPGETP